ncbi:MAG: electron transfer flavoprotein subunit alpha/FixB family protein, partial [Bacteroidales bacterium]|nr:electron transfer flavoprotein subunit alpha/FixB family protein [Bacteroidales bacterium]
MSVLVFAENWDGKFKKLSFELLSYASRTAEMMNLPLVTLSLGKVAESELRKLGDYGAKRIISLDNDIFSTLDNRLYASVISEAAQREKAVLLILAHTNTGKAIAPRLAVRLKAGLASSVSKLPVNIDPFTVYKRTYSGNAFAHMIINSEIRVLTLAQNSFELISTENNATIEAGDINPDSALISTNVKDRIRHSGKILLTDADIVVSGGRGMKSPDNWAPLVELADALGAATACSRPVSDEGWRPHEEHTGQTGKIISPNLYIAVGISGATQHLAGVSASKYI